MTIAPKDLIREIETGRFYVVDEVTPRGVWANRLGKSDSIQMLIPTGAFELILHKGNE